MDEQYVPNAQYRRKTTDKASKQEFGGINIRRTITKNAAVEDVIGFSSASKLNDTEGNLVTSGNLPVADASLSNDSSSPELQKK